MKTETNTFNPEMMASSQIIDVVQDHRLIRNVPASTVMVSAQSDLADLTDCAPGSVAFTAGGGLAWQLAANGEWAPIQNPAIHVVQGVGIMISGHTLVIQASEE